jgi:hypothetical protein
MGLGKDIIHSWDQITKKFLDNYQDYCKDKKKKRGSIQVDAT